jgi:hypothetical protein
MKFFPYGSFLDNVIVIGAHVLLMASLVLLITGENTPIWQICLLLVLAIPGALSFVGGAFEFWSYVGPQVRRAVDRLWGRIH